MYTILTMILVLVASSVDAATINAESPSYAHVSDAIAAAQANDTVVVPAGSATWTSPLTITKGIVLQGAGLSSTTITSNISGGTYQYLINYEPATPSANDPFEVTGFTFDGATMSGILRLWNSSNSVAVTNVKIHGNKFQNAITRAISFRGMEFGVVYSNQFLDNEIAIYAGGSEMTGWNYSLTQGGANYPYIEDNTFTQTIARGGFIVESGQGGRLVFRYNTVIDYGGNSGEVWDAHGVNSTNYPTDTGTVSTEYYNNNIDLVANTRLFHHRGGKSIVFNNTITGGYSASLVMTEYQGWYFHTAASYPKPQQINNTFYWNNYNGASAITPTLGNTSDPTQPDTLFIQLNRDYFLPTSGLDASRPGTCTTDTYYGATNTGKLYKCISTDTWSTHYTPYTYPHPLVTGGGPPPPPPSGGPHRVQGRGKFIAR